MSSGQLAIMLTACLLISLTPGAGAINAMALGADHGVRRAWWSITGQQIALLAQIAIVGAGLGVLVTQTPVIYDVVKIAGAAYLLFLAYKLATAPPVTLADVDAPPARVSGPALLGRGVAVNALNPKAIAFMIAVLPGLIRPGEAPLVTQYVVFAIMMVVIDFAVMTGFASLAQYLQRMFSSPKAMRRRGYVFAALFVVAAVALVAF